MGFVDGLKAIGNRMALLLSFIYELCKSAFGYCKIVSTSRERCKHFLSIGREGKLFASGGFSGGEQRAFKLIVRIQFGQCSINGLRIDALLSELHADSSAAHAF